MKRGKKSVKRSIQDFNYIDIYLIKAFWLLMGMISLPNQKDYFFDNNWKYFFTILKINEYFTDEDYYILNKNFNYFKYSHWYTYMCFNTPV